ncbi:unnamed protein product [Natator depressus]
MGRIPHRPGGPWTGIFLAASILGSCLQPAPAQTPTPVTIILTPPSPVVGGGVSLAPQNPPQDFTSCSWYRSATADGNSQILTDNPGTPPVQTNGLAHTGRETAGLNCSLHIAGLTLNDTGSYMVQIQSPTSPVTITVHLPVSASVLGSCLQPAPAQTPVTIVLTPPSPAVGGGVSLAPQNPPQDSRTCSWYRSDNTDENSRILTYFPGPPPVQTKGSAHTGRETAGPGCALHIAGLRLSDTGSYTVQIQSPISPVLGTVHLPVSDPVAPRPGLSAGAVAGIVIGSLAGAALVGVGAYFLYSRCRNETPRENEAPVPVYENLPPTAGAGPVAQPGSPPDPSPTYQTLQPRQQDVYEELKK